MTTNEHTEQSERAELIERLQSAPADMLGTELEQLYSDCHKAAALLAADKAVGEVAGYVLVNKESREGVMFYSEDMKPDMATIKDKFELVTVYTHPNPKPQPSALPDDVVKDAERYRWLLQTFGRRLHGKPQLDAAFDDDTDDWRDIRFWGVGGPPEISAAIDAAMLKEEKNAY